MQALDVHEALLELIPLLIYKLFGTVREKQADIFSWVLLLALRLTCKNLTINSVKIWLFEGQQDLNCATLLPICGGCLVIVLFWELMKLLQKVFLIGKPTLEWHVVKQLGNHSVSCKRVINFVTFVCFTYHDRKDWVPDRFFKGLCPYFSYQIRSSYFDFTAKCFSNFISHIAQQTLDFVFMQREQTNFETGLLSQQVKPLTS